jgi:chitin disaccharide deacetylase
MSGGKYLIVNADDFGRSPGVNRGIIKAYACGIVTSASLMVRWPAAAEAAAYGQEHLPLSLGLHVDLSEWVYRNGEWTPLYG